MNIFKHQHPADLISRLFILEYMREIGAPVLYAKANKHQKEKMFYKFTTDDDKEEVDINYEYCTFVATLHELESYLRLFLDEIAEVEEKRNVIYDKIVEEKKKAERIKPVDINIMDLASTEIKKFDSNEIIL